ncbi:exonuclease [Caudoviricetes sp.]|nr:exonuclease [Caudoviricetes sp.]
MTAIPEKVDHITAAIDAALESKPNKPRPHLGVSLVGGPCERAIWYNFRWAAQEKFEGRMLRLFDRGAREEETVVKLLQSIGAVVEFTGRNQKRVDFGSHVSGSLDGIIVSGLPGAPKAKHVLEIKTHNKKSFEKLEKEGVKVSKPAHYTQMQLYMLGTEIDRALYFAVCKDDDRIYTERVKFDKAFADEELYRAKKIALMQHPPMKISENASWFECKFCPSADICHYLKGSKNKSCRTCVYSQPLEDSTWICKHYNKQAIPLEFQYKGCSHHEMKSELIDADDIPF